MYSAEPTNCSIAALGADRVMFSADYPFEDSEGAGRFMDQMPMADELRRDMASGNAARLLGVTL
jgi:2,3-dihydroxybenzoate decarboxylase